MDLSTIKANSNWGSESAKLNENFEKVGLGIDTLKYAAYNSKLYASAEALNAAKPTPKVGDWAIVGDTIPGQIYRCDTEGVWTATGQTGGGSSMEVHNVTTIEGVTNLPDDEDLVSVQNEAGADVLQFKNKEYRADQYSGLGRIYLRKNMVGGKNVLKQSMVNFPNTRFIIQYDYDLDGASISIPSGCVLDFQGGSFSNGTIAGLGTVIVNMNDNVIFKYCTVDGNWAADIIKDGWFVWDANDMDALRTIFRMNSDKNTSIYLDKTYTVEFPSGTSDVNCVNVASNTDIYLNGDINLINCPFVIYYILNVENAENVRVMGSGMIDGGKASATVNSGEHGFAVGIRNSKNIKVSGITSANCWGDCIYIANSENVIVSDVVLYGSRRQGLSVTGGRNITISDAVIHDIGGTYPEAGIDIEPNTGSQCDGITIKNVMVYNCRLGIAVVKQTNTAVSNVNIDSCSIYDITEGDIILNGCVANIRNCNIKAASGKYCITISDIGGINENGNSIAVVDNCTFYGDVSKTGYVFYNSSDNYYLNVINSKVNLCKPVYYTLNTTFKDCIFTNCGSFVNYTSECRNLKFLNNNFINTWINVGRFTRCQFVGNHFTVNDTSFNVSMLEFSAKTSKYCIIKDNMFVSELENAASMGQFIVPRGTNHLVINNVCMNSAAFRYGINTADVNDSYIINNVIIGEIAGGYRIGSYVGRNIIIGASVPQYAGTAAGVVSPAIENDVSKYNIPVWVKELNAMFHWNKDKWVNYMGIPGLFKNYGTTSERPTGLSSTHEGFLFYDKTLNKPIWWNGTSWADSSGNVL